MKKFAVLAMVAVGFLSTFSSSEAQVLRRFRDNVREAIGPPILPQQRIQPFNSAQPQGRLQPGASSQPRYVQPQVRIQRPGPQYTTSGPQRLTPYSQVTPQQRVSIPQQRVSIPQQRVSIPQQRVSIPRQRVSIPRQRVSIPQQRVLIPQQRVLIPEQQFSNGPTLTAPVPVGNPTVQSAGGTTVRIVTYLDPRSGRTFQRRYLIPGNSPSGINQEIRGQVVAGPRSIFTQPTTTNSIVAGQMVNPSVNSSIPLSTPTGQSLVPPIQFSPQFTQQPVNVSPGLLPALAGPTLTAPTTIAQPIAASIDSFGNSSQVEPASAQVETASAEIEAPPAEVETSSDGIPDLSGITIEPAPIEPAPMESAPMESAEGADQDLFFEDDFADETTDVSDELDYSVLEEIEEE